MDGLGSASPPVAPTATTGEGRHPCTWPRTFWFKPLSAFGLLDLTTFISSSPELAMPSTLAPNRLSASSRRALSREARPPWVGEVTLSQELRTARSPRPHVLVGYQWSHTGLRPGRKTSHNRYIRSFVSPCGWPTRKRESASSAWWRAPRIRISKVARTVFESASRRWPQARFHRPVRRTRRAVRARRGHP